MAKVSLNLSLPAGETVNFVGTWDVVNEELEVMGEGAFLNSQYDELELPRGKYWARVHLPNNRVETRRFEVGQGPQAVQIGVQQNAPAEGRAALDWLSWASVSEAPQLLSNSFEPMMADELWSRCYIHRGGGWHATEDAVAAEVQANESAIQLQIRPKGGGLIALQVGGARAPSRFVVLPPEGTSRVLITQAKVQRSADADLDPSDPIEIAVSLRSSVADHLARFLAFGSDGSRQRIDRKLANEDGLMLLMEKGSDPLGAAVGGYFLAQDLEHSSGPRAPLGWLERLTDLAPWLADGPTLLAAAVLAEQGESGKSRAIDALQVAATRAYPVLRRGVRLFVDVYQQLVDADVHLPDKLHVHARLLARVSAADTRQTVFTTFYGADPDSPDRQLVLNSESAVETGPASTHSSDASGPRRLTRHQKLFTGLGSRQLSQRGDIRLTNLEEPAAHTQENIIVGMEASTRKGHASSSSVISWIRDAVRHRESAQERGKRPKTIVRTSRWVELGIAASIVVVLTSISLPVYQDYIARSQVSEGIAQSGSIKTAIAEYYAASGELPPQAFLDSLQKSVTIGRAVVKLNVTTGSVIVGRVEMGAQQFSFELTPVTSLDGIDWYCTSKDNPEQLPSGCQR